MLWNWNPLTSGLHWWEETTASFEINLQPIWLLMEFSLNVIRQLFFPVLIMVIMLGASQSAMAFEFDYGHDSGIDVGTDLIALTGGTLAALGTGAALVGGLALAATAVVAVGIPLLVGGALIAGPLFGIAGILGIALVLAL